MPMIAQAHDRGAARSGGQQQAPKIAGLQWLPSMRGMYCRATIMDTCTVAGWSSGSNEQV